MGILSWTENYGDEIFMGLNMSKLKRDEAYLNISTPTTVYLYSLYEECFQCPFTQEQPIENHEILKINTRHPRLWRILKEDVSISPVDSNHSVLCTINQEFGEFGVYDLKISSSNCQLHVLKEPVDIHFPILTVVLIYALILLLVSSCICVWRIYTNKPERQTTSFDKELEPNQKRKRLKSLDTFRGISIVLMIFVNYGCGGYAVFDHAVWNGLQLADIVFPWFMWIMGVCIPISVSSILKKGISKKSSLKNVLRRSCILFGLGLFLGAGPNLDKLRVFGVLQRFGICYFVTASAFILFSSAKQFHEEKKRVFNFCTDILTLKYQWIVAIILLIVHNLLTFMLSIPNCSKGYLGPGGYHDNGKHMECTGGAAGYIDKVILGNHRYQYPTIKSIYKSEAFDPEGILGCLTSIIQVIIGAQAGAIVLFHKGHAARLIRWLIWAVILGLIGGFLCGFSKEDGLIPVNKNLWSISFVLVTSSLAFLFFSLCYCLIDVKEYWSGKPFLFAGMNAILMYVGHGMTTNSFPIRWVPVKEVGLSTHFITLIENVWATGMWVIIAYYLFTIKFFLSI
ncbi:hypothetical protein ILUMI_04480 [Ignelater luminosus]|uniref:Heparan-alpha-glucosaminide N-acetyltransferase n=1 Tax=Ignelater luminosus TaxID=2038154 RepID=A0A8K0DE91_IGNLU|nr:hypothetical protein ILUMI_04480 [Ignelater luminosus]